jgi:putative colanic acid biosynthesis glycosyltransferase
MINSVSGYGSTGSICVDIANELESQGHECFIAFGQISKGYKNGFKIGTKLENNLHNIGSRIFGKQGYFSKNGTNKLIDFIKQYNPDVIHLHNIHGNYLNIEILFDYLIQTQKPVVWTLHDCWAFTGKCAHYTDVSCYKWQTECNNCPQLQTYPPSLFFDHSKTMFNDKKKWFTSLEKLTILTVSEWLKTQVEMSFFKNHAIKTIYNWVDHTVFKETLDDCFIKRYNLDKDKFTIVLVSAGWYSTDQKWKDATKLAALIDKETQLILIGKVEDKIKIPQNITHISYLDGKETLAKAYSFANVYVHLSSEDTFGKVIAEAMSCGTPVIVYGATACPEIVGTACGFVVEKNNLDQVYNAIKKIENLGKNHFSNKCRTRVLENFDIQKNIEATINTYKEILVHDN